MPNDVMVMGRDAGYVMRESNDDIAKRRESPAGRSQFELRNAVPEPFRVIAGKSCRIFAAVESKEEGAPPRLLLRL